MSGASLSKTVASLVEDDSEPAGNAELGGYINAIRTSG
jgi:hypothetical protein